MMIRTVGALSIIKLIAVIVTAVVIRYQKPLFIPAVSSVLNNLISWGIYPTVRIIPPIIVITVKKSIIQTAH